MLHCVDPWLDQRGRVNPSRLIALRHLNRSSMIDRCTIHRDLSTNVQAALPAKLDFAFIDGDHSWAGVETDWRIVAPRIMRGSCVCLHDSLTPATEPWRKLDSQRFFSEVIALDPGFELVESVHSLVVLRKR